MDRRGVGFISGGSGIMGLSNLTLDQISYLVKSVEKLSVIADIVIVDTGAEFQTVSWSLWRQVLRFYW